MDHDVLLCMCHGAWVQELKEANVIIGSTTLPWVSYYLPDLGIYPQAETLFSQAILFIARAWMIFHHTVGVRKKSTT